LFFWWILLAVPGLLLALWLAGIVAACDLSVPPAGVRGFRNVLAVFPHADDETVNCGGVIHLLSSSGSSVTLLLLTAGERGNRAGVTDDALKAVRRREAERASRLLGVSI